MEVIFDRVAGLDIGKETLTVCVRIPSTRYGRHRESRTFKTTKGSLRVMRDWLVECGVTIAAMESTSTYWKPPFYCLEEVMEVWLLNAAHMKAVPGRESDVRDAEWIAQLLEHGLLAPSFVPPPPIRQLRLMTRYRLQLMGDRTRETVRLELMLEDASIKLSTVASSLNTVSARAMLRAMIAGQDDPLVLADLAKGRMRRKIPDLAQALDGHFDAHHAQLAGSLLHRLELVEAAIVELDTVMAEAFAPWQHQLDCCRPCPGSDPWSGRCSSPRPAGTCPASPAQVTWPRGPGWPRRCTSPRANAPPPANATATSGSAASSSKPPAPSGECTARTTSPTSTPG